MAQRLAVQPRAAARRRRSVPIDSYIDEERRCIVARVYGEFTRDEIVETIDRCVRDPEFRPGFGVLSDHTAVEVPLTASQAKQMVEHLVNLTDVVAGTRWAVVTTQAASYAMIRMVSVLAERVPLEVQIFSSTEEAEAWLGSVDESDA